MTTQDAQAGAVYFDGTSSRKHQVTLRVGAALEIVEDGAVVATWPFEAIRRADGSTVNRLRLSCAAAAPLARLEIEDPATIAAVTARSSALDIDRGGRHHVARIVFWSGAADRVDRWHGRLRPAADRRSIGAAGAVFGRAADRHGGRPAGAHVIRRQDLRGAGRQGGVRGPWSRRSGSRAASSIRSMRNVLQHKVPNAIALPGGKVYFFDSLLEKAESPDEVAGILAHELGHVHHRHVMRGIIHQRRHVVPGRPAAR